MQINPFDNTSYETLADATKEFLLATQDYVQLDGHVKQYAGGLVPDDLAEAFGTAARRLVFANDLVLYFLPDQSNVSTLVDLDGFPVQVYHTYVPDLNYFRVTVEVPQNVFLAA